MFVTNQINIQFSKKKFLENNSPRPFSILFKKKKLVTAFFVSFVLIRLSREFRVCFLHSQRKNDSYWQSRNVDNCYADQIIDNFLD